MLFHCDSSRPQPLEENKGDHNNDDYEDRDHKRRFQRWHKLLLARHRIEPIGLSFKGVPRCRPFFAHHCH